MPAILCEHCTAACCNYIALPIDKPETRDEFEDLRWFLLHERIAVFVEDGQWYISFVTPCRHLQADNRCGIYATRPKICRSYSTDNCDYHSGDYGWEQHFTAAEHLDAYRREHAKPGVQRRSGRKSTKPGRTSLKGHPHGRRKGARRKAAVASVDRNGVTLPILPFVKA